MIEINFHPSRREVRQFACLLLPVFLVLVSVWTAWRHGSTEPTGLFDRFHWATFNWALLGLAGVSLVLGWFVPTVMRYVLVGWTCLAFPIGWAVSHSVLILVFFLVFTPVGLVMRLFGRSPLAMKPDPQAETYWEARDLDDTQPQRYLQQF